MLHRVLLLFLHGVGCCCCCCCCMGWCCCFCVGWGVMVLLLFLQGVGVIVLDVVLLSVGHFFVVA